MSAIQAEFSGVDELELRLNNRGRNVMNAVEAAMNSITLNLLAYVKADKLSGQVLHVISDNLRASVHNAVERSDTLIEGRVLAGKNAPYAAAHEFGFTGDVFVKEHLRTSRLGNRFLVHGFTRLMNIPQRSFLRSSLQDKSEAIKNQLRDAVREGTQKQ